MILKKKEFTLIEFNNKDEVTEFFKNEGGEF